MSEETSSSTDANAGGTFNADTLVPQEIQSNLPLVHRILLTDPSDLQNLTITGHPPLLETPPFESFAASLEQQRTTSNTGNTDHDGSAQIANINALVKGAYRDNVCQRMLTNHDATPGFELLEELHTFLRKLIPNRPDLHGLLKTNGDTNEPKTFATLAQKVQQAAAALQALESPARAETTVAFARTLTQQIQPDLLANNEHAFFSETNVRLIVNGLLYLLFKAELCQDDKDSYYLTALWAPAIQTMGPRLERLAFARQYGALHEHPTTAPATRSWIEALVQSSAQPLQHLLQSKHQRWNLIRQGWVEDLLFRPADASALAIPEILAADAGRLQGLRHITRMAAAGSALALLACQAAGQSSEAIALDEDDNKGDGLSILHRRRKVLVQVMADHAKSPTSYQQDVGVAVIEIAKIWKPQLDASTLESLLKRTQKVLEAKDPVIQLLDGRMKDCFRDLVVAHGTSGTTSTTAHDRTTGTVVVAPSHLQSGIAVPHKRGSHHGDSAFHHDTKDFLTKATALFKAKGLTFYASDLANAARLASKVIELALKLYGEELVDPIILDACHKKGQEFSSSTANFTGSLKGREDHT